MRDFTSSTLESVGFSGIRAVFDKASQLEAEGKKVVHLELGRLDFDTPQNIKDAAKKALDEGLVHYTPNLGLPIFREAVKNHLQRELSLSYSDREIIATMGATQGALLAMGAFLERGDEVIIPTPTFVSYLNAPRFFGGLPLPLELKAEDGFQVNLVELEKKISPRTKMLVLISPHNPTGTVLSMETLEGVADLVRRHDLLVLSDEVYDQMVYEGEHISISTLPEMQERTILLNSFSKTYSMTGWRLGYVAAPENLINAMVRVHQYAVGSSASFVQAAGAAALNESQECVKEMTAILDKRRTFLLDNLSSRLVPVKPDGAFYFFLDVRPANLSSKEAVDRLLDQGVATVPGPAFGSGGEGFIRLAYATTLEELEYAVEKIKKVLV